FPRGPARGRDRARARSAGRGDRARRSPPTPCVRCEALRSSLCPLLALPSAGLVPLCRAGARPLLRGALGFEVREARLELAELVAHRLEIVGEPLALALRIPELAQRLADASLDPPVELALERAPERRTTPRIAELHQGVDDVDPEVRIPILEQGLELSAHLSALADLRERCDRRAPRSRGVPVAGVLEHDGEVLLVAERREAIEGSHPDHLAPGVPFEDLSEQGARGLLARLAERA